MARKLVVLANMLDTQGTLSNTEHEYDSISISPKSVAHTGGKDGDFIRIPDCSSSEYYKDHHLLIDFGNEKIAIWNNDDEGHKLYWSEGDFYSDGYPISGSENYDSCSILIQKNAEKYSVSAFKF